MQRGVVGLRGQARRGERARGTWDGRRRGARFAGPEGDESVGGYGACATGGRDASARTPRRCRWAGPAPPPSRGQAPGPPGDGLLECLLRGRRGLRTGGAGPPARRRGAGVDATLPCRPGRAPAPAPRSAAPAPECACRAVRPSPDPPPGPQPPARPCTPARRSRPRSPRASIRSPRRRAPARLPPPASGGCCGPSAASPRLPAWGKRRNALLDRAGGRW